MPEYRTIHSFGEDIVTSLPEHIDSKDICLCYACARFNPNTDLNCPIAQANYELAKRYNLRVPVVACGNFSSIEGTFVDALLEGPLDTCERKISDAERIVRDISNLTDESQSTRVATRAMNGPCLCLRWLVTGNEVAL